MINNVPLGSYSTNVYPPTCWEDANNGGIEADTSDVRHLLLRLLLSGNLATTPEGPDRLFRLHSRGYVEEVLAQSQGFNERIQVRQPIDGGFPRRRNR